MNVAGHYDVIQRSPAEFAVTRSFVKAIRCKHCEFAVNPASFARQGDRSGLPRYARARAVMVKHLHEHHRSKLV